MIRESLPLTALGLALIIVVAGLCAAPYVIGSALIEIAGEEKRRGHGARWAMGCFALFLLWAGYFVGRQLW